MFHQCHMSRQICTYKKATKTRGTGGKTDIAYTDYEEMPILFIPFTKARNINEMGNKTQAEVEAVLSKKYFISLETMDGPQNDDFVVYDNVNYRIIAIEDYSDFKSFYGWHVYMRRDELAH